MIFRLFITICLLSMSLISGSGFAAHGEKPKIVILADNFSGYKSNIAKNIELSKLNKNHQINSVNLENWNHDPQVKLYIALGVKALEALQEENIQKPVLTGLITSSQWLEFKQNNSNSNFSAIFYDPDPEKQIALAKTLMPLTKSLGLLHSDQYQFERSAIVKAGERFDVSIKFSTNNSRDTFGRKYAELSHNNDGILLIPDRINFNVSSLPKAILTSYRQSKFIIGYSKGTVRSGALATSYTSSSDYIEDILVTAQTILKEPSYQTSRFSSKFSVETNREVAKSLGITLPDNAALENIVRDKLSKNTNGAQ